jgi:hypothetical protein
VCDISGSHSGVMKMTVFWDAEPCSPVEVRDPDDTGIALMTEAIQTPETLVNSYQSTWRYNPEDSHLHTHRRENLKL